MDTSKALLVKSLRELVCLSHNNTSQKYPKGRDQHEYKFTDVKGTSEKLQHILRSHKIRSTVSTDTTLHKLLVSFMKLTVVTAKQSTWMDLNGL